MSRISAPRGTFDILPEDSPKWQAVERIAREISRVYHFDEIRTPIYEQSDLFHRGVGENTDIVSKETFTFKDRGDDSLTLRPEGTAGVVRAMIEHNTLAQEGARAKVFYIGPLFRYERPQKGRFRQHHQFGVEAFGTAEADQDAECILLQLDFYQRVGVKDVEMRINSLGDKDSKQRYRDALVQFLSPKSAQLSEESQKRLQTNPLRILDSKDPRDREACIGAPPASESLSDHSRKHLDRVRELLTSSGASFKDDPTLVRGFDYYTETLWEATTSGLGSQNAIGGGGRYDNLVENLGGRPTPGVGFGIGLERLLLALESQGGSLPVPDSTLVWLIHHGDASRQANWSLLRDLRAAGIPADMDLSGRSIKAQFKVADREKATICLVTGDTELAENTIVCKTLATGNQTTLPRDKIVERMRAITNG